MGHYKIHSLFRGNLEQELLQKYFSLCKVRHGMKTERVIPWWKTFVNTLKSSLLPLRILCRARTAL